MVTILDNACLECKLSVPHWNINVMRAGILFSFYLVHCCIPKHALAYSRKYFWRNEQTEHYKNYYNNDQIRHWNTILVLALPLNNVVIFQKLLTFLEPDFLHSYFSLSFNKHVLRSSSVPGIMVDTDVQRLQRCGTWQGVPFSQE